MIKIGVFGGRRGNSMIDWCKKTKRAQVVAVCDRDEEVIDDLKKEYKKGITFCLTFEELLKCDIDAVILTNYAHQHAPFAIKCLNAGKHVLSEVLPCQNMQEAVALVEAAERSGKIYAYAENYCYMPAPREMRKLYRAGKLGEFEYGEGEYIHNCEPIWANITYGDKDHWRNNIIYANFYCTHSLGPLIHVTGLRPISVTGFELPFTDRCARMGRKTGLAGIEMITLENGGIVRSIHGNLDKNSIKYCIYGSKGRAESASYDSQRGGVERIYVNLDEQEGVYNDNPVNYQPKDEISKLAKNIGCNGFHADSDYYVMHNFINALEGKEAEIIDIYEALDMFLPGLFAYFSVLDGGKPQTLPNLREKRDRDKYRNDTRCCDAEVAGDMLLPAYSKCEIEIPDEVYLLVREKYLKNLKEDNKQ